MDNNVPGKGAATGCLVCGILSIVLWFFGWSAIGSVILGIAGIVLASSAKKQGFIGGLRTGGLVCSIVGLIGGSIVFIACVACASCISALSVLS